jgi:hypothetical protein
MLSMNSLQGGKFSKLTSKFLVLVIRALARLDDGCTQIDDR